MGRWGKGIYESDDVLDMVDGIYHSFMREIAYLMAPEQVDQCTRWLGEVITVIELMLLFDKHKVSSIHLIDQQTAIQRWQNTFLSVWNAEWNETEKDYAHAPFRSYDYRVQHRDTMVMWFEHLMKLAKYARPTEKPQPLQSQLPQFYIKDGRGEKNPFQSRFLTTIVDMLIHNIAWILAEENRDVVITFFSEIERVWASIHIMGILCESYAYKLEVVVTGIDKWHQKMTDIWKLRMIEDMGEWEETKSYKYISSLFEKLKPYCRENSYL